MTHRRHACSTIALAAVLGAATCFIPSDNLNFSSQQRLHPRRSGTVTMRAGDNGVLVSISPGYY